MRRFLCSTNFFKGALYPFIAVQILSKNKNLWQYLTIPISINLLVGMAIYLFLLFPSWNFIQNLVVKLSESTQNLPLWLGVVTSLIVGLGWLVKILLILALFIAIGFLITQFGAILGSPWYGKLSEKLEEIKTGNVDIIEVNIVTDIWRAILFELKKIIFIFLFGLPLLLINLVPSIGNVISALGWIVVTATIVCLDFLDPPLERRRFSFREKLRAVWRGAPATFGFSLVCLVLVSIPLLNLVIIPICVASGTLLFCDRLYSPSNP